MTTNEEPKLKKPPIPRFYTVPETACILNVGIEEVRTWIKEGLLKAYCLSFYGNFTHIHSQDLDEFIREYVASRSSHPG